MENIISIEEHRIQTKEQILDYINKYQRFACVRPTGYGKSYLIAELCGELSGNKIIIEPTTALKNSMQKYKNIFNGDVNIVTYASLLKKDKSFFISNFQNINYIFVDEMHRLGAEKWGKAVRILMDAYPNAQVIGMSATPKREDGNNVIETVFSGIQIPPLYLGEAIAE